MLRVFHPFLPSREWVLIISARGVRADVLFRDPLAYTVTGFRSASKQTGGLSLASTGTIQFRIFTSNASIPVENATVVVRLQNPPGTLLGVLTTDESGQTPPLTVETGDVALSQTPENLTEPWVGLTVRVEHPEFERVLLTGIQIFPGILTIQNVQLLPLRPLDPDQDRQQEFDFTPQPIWEGGRP